MNMKTFDPTWNSLSRHQMPQWLQDAKYGIYTHWGIYSVPAYAGISEWTKNPNASWYGNRMYNRELPEFEHHRKTYGDHKEFGYKDFIPMFKAEKFDADEWAQLFKDAGAQFAGPVAVHHDNFSMWDSKVNPWNSAAMGPKRDITGELEKAIKGQGMKFITTFHHAWNWNFFPKNEAFDTLDPAAEGLYSRKRGNADMDEKYLQDWYDQVSEVVEKYDPDMLWFDFGLGHIPDRYRKHMLAAYYNRAAEAGKEVTVAYKSDQLTPFSGLYDLEMGKMNKLTPHHWLTDTCVDASPGGCWGHVKGIGYKSPERLIHNLVDRVSKNGYLLLNVGPRADGTIPEPAQECLREIGKWLAINGEAIFGTVPWVLAGDGPTKTDGGGGFNENNEARFTCHDVRYTCKDNALYVTALGRPGEQVICPYLRHNIDFPKEDILNITMLGGDGASLPWEKTHDGLCITVPEKVPSPIAVSFKIETRGEL
jgi:alpha-L-fucosidase